MNIQDEIEILRAAAEEEPSHRKYRLASVRGKNGKGGQVGLIARAFTDVLTDKSREMRLRCLCAIFPFGPRGEISSTSDLSDAEAHVLIGAFYESPNFDELTDFALEFIAELERWVADKDPGACPR